MTLSYIIFWTVIWIITGGVYYYLDWRKDQKRQKLYKENLAWLEDNCDCNGANHDTCPYCRRYYELRKIDGDTQKIPY